MSESSVLYAALRAMQRIIVVQQSGSGEAKIVALRQRGRDLDIRSVISIDDPLPQLVDDPEIYLPDDLDADLVLSFLKHPDLAHELALRCRREGVPLVASGRRIPVDGVITPPT